MPQNKKNSIRSRIYQLIHSAEPLSRSEIARRLHISMPTALSNIDALMEAGLIRESSALESTGGRRAIGLVLVHDLHFAIGVDITKNHISIVLADLKGVVVDSTRVVRPFANDPAYYQALSALVDGLVAGAGVSWDRVLGIGYALPGIVSDDGQTLIYSHLLGVSGISEYLFRHRRELPVILLNDANAAGFAEMWPQPAQDNALYLSLSNSVGGAVMIRDRCLSGASQRCGEFGHMTLVPGGERCYCGKLGCADAYLNASLLAGHTGENLRQFFERLRAGEPALQPVWERYLGHLAVVVNNLTTAFDYPIVLGGYVGSCLTEAELARLREKVAQLSTFSGNEQYVLLCRYKFEAAALGAALHWIAAFEPAL